MQTRPTLAIIGGTGALGTGLAMRWAGAGYTVVLGSRTREKAEEAAHRIESRKGAPPVRGLDNRSAAAACDEVLSLPLHPRLGDHELGRIAAAVGEFSGKDRKE